MNSEERSALTHRVLQFELWRTGKGHHWDPKRSKPRKPVLLCSWMVVTHGPVPLHMNSLVWPESKYPYGYHWVVKDDKGTILGVEINELFPAKYLFEEIE